MGGIDESGHEFASGAVDKGVRRGLKGAGLAALPSNCPNRPLALTMLRTEIRPWRVLNDRFSRLMIVSTLVAVLCACSGSQSSHTVDETQQLSPRVIKVGDPVPKGGGVWKLGEPYLAGGKWYTPVNDQSYDRVGLASWYGDFFHGRRTANGEVYDMNALTGAHPTLPLPTYVTVTNLANNRSIVVRINDRGPYHDNRIIDLSHRAAKELGFYGSGTAAVRVRYLGPAPMNGDDHYERSVLARQPWATQVVSQAQPAPQPNKTFLAAAVMTEWPVVKAKSSFEGRAAPQTQAWTATAQPVSASSASFTGGR